MGTLVQTKQTDMSVDPTRNRLTVPKRPATPLLIVWPVRMFVRRAVRSTAQTDAVMVPGDAVSRSRGDDDASPPRRGRGRGGDFPSANSLRRPQHEGDHPAAGCHVTGVLEDAASRGRSCPSCRTCGVTDF